jgi:anti-sigma regulatory factor (Ser/Thr protein kinase)
MSKLFTHTLPEVITVEALAEIQYKLREADVDVDYCIDWSLTKTLLPDAACMLKCMWSQPKLRNATSIGNQQSPIYSQFNDLLNYQTSELQPENATVGFFLSSANDEATIVSRKQTMVDYLRSVAPLGNVDLTGVEQVFGELYMNVCQHAACEGGLVYIPNLKNGEQLSVIVVDLGTGIAANIKKYFPDYEPRPDQEAIAYATQDFITTKSTAQNYGRGLAFLLNMADTSEGEVSIVSGNGKLIRRNAETHLAHFDNYFQGTLIHLQLNIRNFDKEEPLRFDEDVDF